MIEPETFFIAVAWPGTHPWQRLREELYRQQGRRLRIGLHVTVIAPFTTGLLEACLGICERCRRVTPRFTIECTGLSEFGGPPYNVNVVLRAAPLLALHSRLEEGLNELATPTGQVYPTYTPHLTLAQKLTTLERDKVRDALTGREFTDTVQATALTLYRLDTSSPLCPRWEKYWEGQFSG